MLMIATVGHCAGLAPSPIQGISPLTIQLYAGGVLRIEERRKRARQEIISACYQGLDSFALRRRVLQLLGDVVPSDGAFFPTADPATLLYTSAVRVGMPTDATPLFVRNEFTGGDVNHFRALARAPRPVNWLDRATGGDRLASDRYREIMRPIGFGDELRAAFRTKTSCWGFLCLHREDGPGGFSAADATFVASLVPHVAEGLQRSIVANDCQVEIDVDGPGVAILREGGVVDATPAARRWLAELNEGDARLPIVVQATVGRLATMTAAETGQGAVPRATVRTAAGRWLTVHASWLGTEEQRSDAVSVVIEPTGADQLAPVIVAALGFTSRERQVVEELLKGLSVKQIAYSYSISEHTVHDHVKAIFTKAGVKSRGELLAAVFQLTNKGFAAPR